MQDRPLTLEDSKALQLEMLKEIDSFCRENDIKYALSCGTLIGAVRHKGYIPWDDDVDITMLYPDMLKFKKLFKSKNMLYCDIDVNPNFEYMFSRILSLKTFSKLGSHRCEGVCIDLYPIVECSSDVNEINKLLPKGQKLLETRMNYIKWHRRLQRYTPFTFLPGFRKSIRNYYNFMFNDIQKVGGGSYYQIGGPIVGNNNNFFHNMWSFNPLEEVIVMPFENLSFSVPARYDEMLSIRYGDYMQLPPEDQRHPYHGFHYYWK